jgi:hypothetical protein
MNILRDNFNTQSTTLLPHFPIKNSSSVGTWENSFIDIPTDNIAAWTNEKLYLLL